MIVNQSLLGVLDRVLDRLQLLSKLQTRPALLDHLDDHAKMAVGTLETPDDRGMTVMWHLLLSATAVCSAIGIDIPTNSATR
jgi:hypothetical protein